MQLDIEPVLNNKKTDETTKQTTDKNNASKTTDEKLVPKFQFCWQ